MFACGHLALTAARRRVVSGTISSSQFSVSGEIISLEPSRTSNGGSLMGKNVARVSRRFCSRNSCSYAQMPSSLETTLGVNKGSGEGNKLNWLAVYCKWQLVIRVECKVSTETGCSAARPFAGSNEEQQPATSSPLLCRREPSKRRRCSLERSGRAV